MRICHACERHIIFSELGTITDLISITRKRIDITRTENLTLNFPADTLREVGLEEISLCGFSIKAQAVYKGKSDYMVVFENEEQVRALEPDFHQMKKIPARGIIVTAPGTQVDFVSRFFAPQSGIRRSGPVRPPV
jgi:predicted PhzF superfamily epimerase YddE/YHI9